MFRSLTLAVLVVVLAAADWPQFRGPNAIGVSDDHNIPVRFSENDGILWKIPIPGRGNSSPIVSKGKLFLQSASDDGQRRWLLCFDAKSGKTLWTHESPGGSARAHRLNSMASSTPCADGERVYAVIWDGRSCKLSAFDYDGKPLWSQDLGEHRSQHGAGTSPIVENGRVFVNYDQDRFDFRTRAEIPGAEHSTAIRAFDAKSGRPLWRTEREGYFTCYSIPILRDCGAGRHELVVTSTTAITGYDPATGKVNWNWDWPWADGAEKLRTVATSVMWKDIVYATGGNGGGNSRVVAVRAGGPGRKAELVWEKNRGSFSYVPCLLVCGDSLFTVHDKTGIAGCYEAATGKPVWTRRLVGEFRSSPVLIDGRIYLISASGDVYVYPAEASFKLLARNSLGEDVQASPAVSDGRLYIRGAKHLFCIGSK